MISYTQILTCYVIYIKHDRKTKKYWVRTFYSISIFFFYFFFIIEGYSLYSYYAFVLSYYKKIRFVEHIWDNKVLWSKTFYLNESFICLEDIHVLNPLSVPVYNY